MTPPKRNRPKATAELNRRNVEAIIGGAIRRGQPPNLTGAYMRDLDLSGIDFTSPYRPEESDLFNSTLLAADFRGSKLVGCRFSGADVACANMRGTNLTGAKMVGTNLYNTLFQHAVMSHTDLRNANLVSAELQSVRLDHANVTGAHFGWTSIGNVDLSMTLGLEKVVHVTPSLIGSDSLRLTANGLHGKSGRRQREIFTFLSNAGLEEEFVSVVRKWIRKPVKYHSVFLSHSSLDNDFSMKLYEDLRSEGVNCWFDEKQLLPGDRTIGQVDQAIRRWDRVILVCSKSSLSPRTGWWVEQELERALEKERELRKRHGRFVSVLIPIQIDDYVFDEWSSPYKATVCERHIGDFRGWRNSREYSVAFGKLVRAMTE
jgi:hypothetical protein